MHTPTYKAVIRYFEAKPTALRGYFEHLPSLVENYPWEVCIAYAFSRIEKAHVWSLYCGAVKLHSAHAEVTWAVLESKHLTRPGFQQLFAVVFNKPIPDTIISKIKGPEKTRDRALHGKPPSDGEMRQAVVDAIDYAHALDDFIESTASFRPFGDLRGFKGRGQPLEKDTTRWLLKGMGF